MAIIKWRPRDVWSPFRDLLDIQEEMNRFLDWPFGRRCRDKEEMTEGLWYPAVDIHNGNDSITVKADLPGIDPKALDIKVVGNTLTIKGEKKSEVKEEEEGYVRVERSCGKFERSFEILETIDISKIEANYKDGVLKIKLPKKEEVKPKEITVKVS